MHSLQSILLLSISISAALCHLAVVSGGGKTVTVDPSGGGDFKTVQEAIDSVPDGNADWIQIFVKAGVYSEKIKIAKEKQFIFLKGEGIKTTAIVWGDYGRVMESSTFSLYADNFCAADISFKNSHTNADKNNITWAPAALVLADKVSFYRCGFTGLQDTLSDFQGRHYYETCFIEGAIDFIWGRGQSMFKNCHISVQASLLGSGPGYITAQGRTNPTDTNAFVFNQGSITGTGSSYLGRAYGQYSTVIFYQTQMDNVIVPEGWDAWNHTGQESSFTYAEEGCTGPGADQSKRVPWEKKLASGDLSKFTDLKSFIDQDGWMETQPMHPDRPKRFEKLHRPASNRLLERLSPSRIID